MNRQDALNTLNLQDGASKEAVTKAYRKMAMKHHPDRNVGDAHAEERFKAVQLAYDSLTGESSPAAPLGGANRWGFQGGVGAEGFADLFGAIFGGSSMGVVEAGVSLADALKGARLRVDQAPWGAPGKPLTIALPPKVAHGSEFMVEANGRQRVLRVRVEAPAGWRLEGRVISTTIKLSLLDQMLGVKARSLALPDGQAVALDIPPGMAQGSPIVVAHPALSPYEVRVRVDFSREMRLNDNERNQLEAVRRKVLKREEKNGK